MARQNLACFGLNGIAPRLYYLDLRGHVNELALGDHWTQTDVTAASSGRPAALGGALACFGVGGTVPRVYHLDAGGHVIELGLDNNNWWVQTDMTVASGAKPAAPGSALTCFGIGGRTTRLYYLSVDSHVNELGWDSNNSKWAQTDMTAAAGAAPAAPGSALTCFGVGGATTRLYYLDPRGHVNELGWDNRWVHTDITAAGNATAAVPGSALTCFGIHGGATRLYYLDEYGHVNELGWENRWVHADISAAARLTPAAPIVAASMGSALTCFGVGGATTRVYFLDVQSHLHELGWDTNNNRWAQADITGAAGATAVRSAPTPSAAPGSGLACFGVQGNSTRLYYINGDGYAVNELAWQNHWVNRVLAVTHAPTNPVAAPSGGLGSNSNYKFYSPGIQPGTCNHLLGLTVSVDITTDLAGSEGFGFQVNAFSPQTYQVAGQQYLIFLDPTKPGQLMGQANNYPLNGGALINNYVPLVTLPSQKLPVGYRLTIGLNSDGAGNIIGATYIVVDRDGTIIGNQTITLPAEVPALPPTRSLLAPIVAFQLNLVAYQNDLATKLSSGVGTISYWALDQMTVSGEAPACAGSPGFHTYETSNSVYGAMPATPGNSFTQTFQTALVPGPRPPQR